MLFEAQRICFIDSCVRIRLSGESLLFFFITWLRLWDKQGRLEIGDGGPMIEIFFDEGGGQKPL